MMRKLSPGRTETCGGKCIDKSGNVLLFDEQIDIDESERWRCIRYRVDSSFEHSDAKPEPRRELRDLAAFRTGSENALSLSRGCIPKRCSRRGGKILECFGGNDTLEQRTCASLEREEEPPSLFCYSGYRMGISRLI